MAILGASFSIGRSALAAYQAAIAVTGQNLANVGNPDYARQSGHLAALAGGGTAGVSPGSGVRMDLLQRHVDASIERGLRTALAQRSHAQTTYQMLNRVEGLYGELTDYDLSTMLSELFGAFTSLQTDPADNAKRDLVVSSAEAVITTLQRYRHSLLGTVSDLNDEAATVAQTANGMAGEIAQLNEQIVVAAARGTGGDSALRDRRDALLRDLAQLMDIQTREQERGVINVYVGSEPLVEFNRSRGLTTVRTLEDGVEHTEVRFADNNGRVRLGQGHLAALVETSDTHLADQLHRLDQLARGLIYEVNRVHTGGVGLLGYTSLTGAFDVDDPNAVLTSPAAGLTYPITSGTFMVNVRDRSTGIETTRMIRIDLDGIDNPGNPNDNDTTLTALAAQLNGVPGMTAQVTPDNRLQLVADPAYEFYFSQDSSGALAALGVGVFFEGIDAETIAVSSLIRGNPQLIATSQSGAPGDGSNAGLMASVFDTASSLLGGLSVQGYQQGITNDLAVTTAAAETAYEASDAVYSSLLAQRESISGVSLDEEAINLTLFERSFQGAARYLSVLDTLSTAVLELVP